MHLSDLDLKAVNTIRMLAVDSVEQAASGHPGMPMGMAQTAYVLWTRYLRHSPRHPDWQDRDRFVLSAGHGSMLLYALLHLTGYDLPLDELKNFRQWQSKTPGHPEFRHTAGVETTTGPLGRGSATAWAWPWPRSGRQPATTRTAFRWWTTTSTESCPTGT